MTSKRQTKTQHREKLPMLSPKELLIMELLITRGEMYGLELVNDSKGELKRGTVYVTLNRMEEKGYIESKPEARPPLQGGLHRRIYKLTVYGGQVIRTWGLLRGKAATEGWVLAVCVETQ